MAPINNTMSPIKIKIIHEIKAQRVDPLLPTMTDDEINSVLFHNPATLRLSLHGLVALSKIFTPYKFELPANLKSRQRIALSKFEYPYFLSTRRLVVFSEMDAVMIRLHGGVDTFLDNCYQIDHR